MSFSQSLTLVLNLFLMMMRTGDRLDTSLIIMNRRLNLRRNRGNRAERATELSNSHYKEIKFDSEKFKILERVLYQIWHCSSLTGQSSPRENS